MTAIVNRIAGLAWTRRELRLLLTSSLLLGLAMVGWGHVSQWLIRDRQVSMTVLGWSYPVWFLGGLVAAALLRKPGAAFLGESLAALTEALLLEIAWKGVCPTTTCSFAGAWSYVVSGLVQGAGAELGFALGGYRRWGPGAFVAAGCLSWWFGWLKGLYSTGCYTWQDTGLLLTATISTAAVAAVLGMGWSRRDPQEERL